MVDPKKQNNILSFFKPVPKPVPKQPPTKRTFPDGPLVEDGQLKSKSSKRSDANTGPSLFKSDSSKTTQSRSSSNALLSRENTGASSELSTVPALSDDSDDGDIVVIQVPSEVPERSNHTVSNLSISQSFTSSASSSHRIERYGETIVTGSDDESDDLLDLDKLLDRKPLQTKPARYTKQETQSLNKFGRKPKHTYQDTSKADQIKFNNLMEKAKKDLAKSVNQRKALEQAKEVEQQSLQAPSNLEATKTTLTAETIMSRVGDLDGEKAEKFAQVIERTELIQDTQSWSFFGAGRPGRTPNFNQQQPNRKWPELQSHPEWSVYKDSTQRDLAFISGVFEQAAAVHQLPEEILLWILTQSFIEPQADLRDTYLLVLGYADICVSSDQILKRAESVLQGLGATTEAMSMTSEQIQSKSSDIGHHEDHTIPRKSLCIWLQNVRKLAKSMSAQDRSRLLDLLFTLSLDTAIPNDSSVLTELQATLRVYIEYLEEGIETKKILAESLKRIWSKAGNVHFRLQFLKCMPITTCSVARLRKRFAVASFYESPTWLDSPLESNYLHDLGAFVKSDKQFQMTKKTNYHDLAASIACFDIAIGAGEGDKLDDPTNIKQFNAVIDDLTGIVGAKNARIQTTGAVHMSRTEVKDALTTIEKRLSFTVRTERKRHQMYEQLTLDNVVQR